MKRLFVLPLCLLLLAGCGQAKPTQETSAAATATPTTATTTEDMSTPWQNAGKIPHTITESIHPSMQRFHFTLQGVVNRTSEFGPDGFEYTTQQTLVNAIDITEDGGKFQQKLDGFETHLWPLDYFCFELCDFNSDGYSDIKLLKTELTPSRDIPAWFWLWDPQENKFVENQQLEELSEKSSISMQPDVDSRLMSFVNVDAWGYSVSYYIYQGGNFVKVEEQLHLLQEEEGFVVYEVQKLINGEMKTVSKTREKLREGNQ